MNKKSGSPGSLIAPIQPQAAVDAVEAQAGEVSAVSAASVTAATFAYSPHPFRPATRASREILTGRAATGGVSTRPTGWTEATSGSATQVSDWREASSTPTSWIEIELVGEDDRGVPGEAYRVQLPDGSFVEGTLDTKGRARIRGFAPAGQCQVSFPYLDKDAWEEI